jgi:dTDP-N-acetylfucosamine:lipid II N-acetylfucosaminyltransferase
MDQTIKAVHIFTDSKFIPWVKSSFALHSWESTFIVLQSSSSAVGAVEPNVLCIRMDSDWKIKVLEIINSAHIVFYYLLDNHKASLILDSSGHAIHSWCFYGAEIYQQTPLFRDMLYGPVTRKYLWLLPEIKYRVLLRSWYFRIFKREKPPVELLQQAIKKISGILWYVPEEIAFINSRIKLPPWYNFQFFSFSDIIPDPEARCQAIHQKILIGNSATIENNHLDVLEVLQKVKNQSYSVSLPMTYGLFPRYKALVKRQFSKALKERAFFLENHMPLEQYYSFLAEHPTAVFLHHRQQALGNVLYMLYIGAKVYLSRDNIIIQWLRNNQVRVFIFEDDFFRDMNSDNMILEINWAEENRKQIRILLDHQHNMETIQQLEQLIKKNRP